MTAPLGEGRSAGWWEGANCASTDWQTFFLPAGRLEERDAKRVCGRCRIRRRCLIWAMAQQDLFGVWGGLSDRERWGRGAQFTNPNWRGERCSPIPS